MRIPIMSYESPWMLKWEFVWAKARTKVKAEAKVKT